MVSRVLSFSPIAAVKGYDPIRCQGRLPEAVKSLEVNSIALLKYQQTFQQSFYSSVGHPVVLAGLGKIL